ncbi:hypothetical protein D2Q93_01540 [Alicyclobacillaceae bacterium I2511]|nr:hypothetical protein D2Q93_01540 [Alicyclobacillaceae bacterium I2511]
MIYFEWVGVSISVDHRFVIIIFSNRWGVIFLICIQDISLNHAMYQELYLYGSKFSSKHGKQAGILE